MSGRGAGRGDRGRGRGGAGPRGGYDSQRGGRGGGAAGAPQVYAPPDGSPVQPNQQITKVEDKFQSDVSSGDSLGLGKLRLGSQFPIRPGYGTRGQPVLLFANYLEFIPPPDLPLYRYAIEMSPKPSRRKQWTIINLLLEMPQLAQDRKQIVTDYSAFLISCKKLSIPANEKPIPIKFKNEGEDDPADGAQVFQVKIIQPDELRVSDLMNAISSTDLSNNYDKGPLLQALNIWLGHHAKRTPGLVSVGGSKAVSLGQNTPTYNLGAGLIAWRGFFSSIRVATSRILVNINVSHRVFWEPVPLDQLFAKYAPSTKNRIELQSAFKNIRVKTNHLPAKKNKKGQVIIRVKTIWSFANVTDGRRRDGQPVVPNPPRVKGFAAGPQDVEFFIDDMPAPKGKENVKGGKKPAKGPASGKYISVKDYFKTTYGRTNLNPNLPVINVGNRENPMYLPMEVCTVMEGQSAGIVLPPAQTQGMIKFAVRKPWENFNSIINDGVPTVGLLGSGNAQMGAFGINVPRKFLTVPGRVLPVPKIVYRQNKSMQPRFGSWNMIDIKFTTGSVLRSWAVLMISRRDKRSPDAFPDQATAQRTINDFRETLNKCGMTVDPPKGVLRIQVMGPNDPQIEEKIKNAPGNPEQARLVLVILPEADIPIYRNIKRLGDIKYGVHTACVVGSKLATKGAQYYANEGLKINMKLGGINQTLPNLGIINQGKTMVVGADVTHPSPASGPTAPSVAGMVCSVDKSVGQFLPELRVQERRKEMITDMGEMLKTGLRRWTRIGKNAQLPENILVYRDGVSEGQYQTVLEEELPLLEKACKEMYPPQSTAKNFPRMTIIIVGKRHHTRFTVTKVDDADRSHNPKNGTVVDRGITEARNWDFFLQAHTALQGTARPAHYFIVLDQIFAGQKLPPGMKNTADVIEDLTHNMCYMFGRATKAVSICPPAYYADILCERARCYLSGVFDTVGPGSTMSADSEVRQEDLTPHPMLRDTMFFA